MALRSKVRQRIGGGGLLRLPNDAPLRDGDPLVFMNEPSRVGWSVMALRTNLRTDGKPSSATLSCLQPRRKMHDDLHYYTLNMTLT